MKIKYGKRWLSTNNAKDMKMVKIRMADDGEWEYDRLGIGTYKGQVFMVDLNDINETWRVMNFVDKVQSIQNVLDEGVELGVFVEIDYGYDSEDKYRVTDGGDEDGFYGVLNCNWDNSYYSFMEKE